MYPFVENQLCGSFSRIIAQYFLQNCSIVKDIKDANQLPISNILFICLIPGPNRRNLWIPLYVVTIGNHLSCLVPRYATVRDSNE